MTMLLKLSLSNQRLFALVITDTLVSFAPFQGTARKLVVFERSPTLKSSASVTKTFTKFK